MARRASMKREVSEETPANDSATKQPEKEKDVLWDEDLALFIFKQCFMSRIIIFCIQFIFNIIVTDFPSDAFKGISIPKRMFPSCHYFILTFITCSGISIMLSGFTNHYEFVSVKIFLF
ncbi:hypothetical protein AB6A40_011541 [Gnathostoma spinigerum]|uniref:Uncharacterized protein n=1 Tax=Gnathostoma spinigerum TaxID=75299 RepID=A0ABD6F4H4_9BILA